MKQRILNQASEISLLFLLVAVSSTGQGYLNTLESNKKLISDFHRLVVEPRNTDLVEVYVSPEFVEHEPSEQKGIESVVKMLKAATPAASEEVGSALPNPPAFIMAQGDLVVWMFKQNVPDPQDKSKTAERFSLEVYRIKDRKIVEHWKGLANLP